MQNSTPTLDSIHSQNWHSLISWSKENFHHLPWRKEVRPLYEVLVAEIMLQQTTVGTVLPRYSSFLETFPTAEKLASSDEDALRDAWQGLGYYRRAQNLLKAVSFMVAHKDLPQTREELMQVPGIGPYTASALQSIGRNRADLAVDGNLQRVLSRVFSFTEPLGEKLTKQVRTLLLREDFAQMLEQVGGRALNEALMDLGREVCKPKKPACLNCPLKPSCSASNAGRELEFPNKIEKKKIQYQPVTLARLLIEHPEHGLLVYRKRKGEWLNQQWELPTFVLEGECAQQYPTLPKNIKLAEELFQLPSAITRYRIRNKVFRLDTNKFTIDPKREWSYYQPESKLHLGTACRKILKQLEN